MSDALDPELQRAIELARELPADVPALAHREQIRTSLLARAEGPVAAPRRTGRYAVAAFGAVAAAATAYLATHPAEPAANAADATSSTRMLARAHGHVHPHAAAVLGIGAPLPDEIVQLHDGTIDVEVDPLGPGERFRVLVGASEIEVRGTAFTVVAERDRLLDVHVAHGRVEVRPAGAPPAVLDAGAAWHAPALVPAPPPPVVEQASTPSPPPVAHREPAPRVAPPPPPPPPVVALATDQLAYNDAWSALRAQRFHAAAAAFARALALAPDGPLADDARYWHAVALAREPRAADAIVAFRELLDEHPGSVHHGEASAMLGWLLVDAKQLAEARRRFEAAAADPGDDVRASARAGLAALPP